MFVELFGIISKHMADMRAPSKRAHRHNSDPSNERCPKGSSLRNKDAKKAKDKDKAPKGKESGSSIDDKRRKHKGNAFEKSQKAKEAVKLEPVALYASLGRREGSEIDSALKPAESLNANDSQRSSEGSMMSSSSSSSSQKSGPGTYPLCSGSCTA